MVGIFSRICQVQGYFAFIGDETRLLHRLYRPCNVIRFECYIIGYRLNTLTNIGEDISNTRKRMPPSWIVSRHHFLCKKYVLHQGLNTPLPPILVNVGRSESQDIAKIIGKP